MPIQPDNIGHTIVSSVNFPRWKFRGGMEDIIPMEFAL